MVMSILYKDSGYGFKVAVLHRINYSSTESHLTIHRWCEKNCKGGFYTSPGWAGQFVEFENDEDAVWFALGWSCD